MAHKPHYIPLELPRIILHPQKTFISKVFIYTWPVYACVTKNKIITLVCTNSLSIFGFNPKTGIISPCSNNIKSSHCSSS